MRSTIRSLAIAASILLLPAAAATPALARADGAAPTPGMTHMHEQMMDGTDMDRMHGLMMTVDHAGMTRMHDRMMTDETGAQPETTS